MQVSLELTYLDENKNTIFEFDSNSIEDKKPIQLNLEKELDNKVAVPEMNTNGPYGYLAQMIVDGKEKSELCMKKYMEQKDP